MPLSAKSLLIALPAVTVACVAFALFLVGPKGPVPAARIYGGPTENAEVLAWRVLAFERSSGFDRVLRNARLRVEVELGSGRVIAWGGSTATDGLADVELLLGRHSQAETLIGTVTWESPQGPRTLVRAPVNLKIDTWKRYQRRRTGKSEQQHADVSIRVTPVHGVLAVPFDDELTILVKQHGEPAAGVHLDLSGEGLDFLKGRVATTDEHGQARVRIRPTFHQILLTIEARREPNLSGRYRAELPVVPGAIRVTRRPKGETNELFFESPVPRDRAYFSLVSREQRLLGGSVALRTLQDGTSVGSVLLRQPLVAPLWVVASDAFDLKSFAAVGWPVALTPGTGTGDAFDVPDLPLADGLPAALRQEKSRQRHAHLVAALLALFGLVPATWLLVRVVQSSRSPELDLALVELAQSDGPPTKARFSANTLWVAVGIFLTALGFVLLALFALIQP